MPHAATGPSSVARRAAIALLALAAVVGPLPAVATAAEPATRCEAAAVPVADTSLGELRSSISCLLGEERAKRALPRTAGDARLATAAQGLASQMVDEGFFAHRSPAGETLTDRLRRAGWLPKRGRWGAGEILANGTPSTTPRGIVDAWLASPTHLAVLRTRSFDRLGVGLVRGRPQAGRPGLTVVAEFGRR